ncbi:MAG: phosphotransferase-like protein [Acidimicrobiales bacterium]
MTVEVVVLNGGSSSGKSSIARRLQSLLGPTWLVFGVDDLIRALPGGDVVDDRIRALSSGGNPPVSQPAIEFGCSSAAVTWFGLSVLVGGLR